MSKVVLLDICSFFRLLKLLAHPLDIKFELNTLCHVLIKVKQSKKLLSLSAIIAKHQLEKLLSHVKLYLPQLCYCAMRIYYNRLVSALLWTIF